MDNTTAQSPANPFPNDIVFFDCEATGLKSESAQIIELGIVSATGETLLSQLAKPTHSIPPHIVELTGISDRDVAKAPSERQLLQKAHPIFLAARAIGGYFIHLDYQYLKHAYRRADMAEEFKAIAAKPLLCAKTLARQIIPEIGLDFSLPDLCKSLQITPGSNHRATDDAIMSQRAILKLAERSSQKTLQDLLALQGPIVQSPWEMPGSPINEREAARTRWEQFVASCES